MMCRISLPAFLCFTLTTSLAVAQERPELPSPAQVIARHVKATGGAKAYQNWKSMQATGTVELPQQGIKGTLMLSIGGGGRVATTAEIANLGTERAGSDGKVAWSISPFTGARILEGDERAQVLQEADLQADLHPEKYFKSMTVVGTEKVGDEDCYKLERVRHNDEKQTDYFSVKTGLQVKSVARHPTPLGKIEITSTVSDYRQVGDLKLPFRTEQKLPGDLVQVIKLESIQVNQPLDDKQFALPDAIRQLQNEDN